MSDRILVVDDEAVLRNNLARFLGKRGFDVDTAASGEEALERCRSTSYALVITDQRMPGIQGLELIRRLRDEHPSALVILMTAYASVDSAIEALRLGAADYLLKPVVMDNVARKVRSILRTRELNDRVRRLRQELQERVGAIDLVGRSPAMAAAQQLIERIAPTPANILIEGESGTGKELVARALHERSNRSEKDFIPVNLSAQPAELVDAMLFGHEKGAYTGATQSRPGVFRAVRGGTVFLDEIGDLPAPVQVKLLRVIENREVLPLGCDRPVPVEFRLVAATNRSLEKLVEKGEFREDLYFRLNVVRIELPPLRQRREDLPELATRLLERHARNLGRPALRLTDEALRRLETYAWPGNVRELSNVLERAVLLADGQFITPEDLPRFSSTSELSTTQLKPAIEHFERAHIRRVLTDCAGDKRRAAESLGIHLATLYRHLERLGLN